eukprot:6393906-Amphidinium_carterae.2
MLRINSGFIVVEHWCGGAILVPRVAIPFVKVLLFLGRGSIDGAFQIAYIFTPEIYPTSIRGTAIGPTVILLAGLLVVVVVTLHLVCSPLKWQICEVRTYSHKQWLTCCLDEGSAVSRSCSEVRIGLLVSRTCRWWLAFSLGLKAVLVELPSFRMGHCRRLV